MRRFELLRLYSSEVRRLELPRFVSACGMNGGSSPGLSHPLHDIPLDFVCISSISVRTPRNVTENEPRRAHPARGPGCGQWEPRDGAEPTGDPQCPRPRSPRPPRRPTPSARPERQVLDQAASRPDLALLPMPESLHLTGHLRSRLLRSLLDLNLAEECPCKEKAGSWRRDGHAHTWSLHLSKAGLAIARPDTPSSSSRRPTKQAQVLSALAAPGGATLDDLVVLAGWLAPHTTRSAQTRLRQRGHHRSGNLGRGAGSAGPQPRGT